MAKSKHQNMSLAKVTPPRLPKVVERQRLFKELDRARDYPVIWMTAPPGMGKTTLMASYLKARKLPCLWYQVDEGDADPATLFHYLGLASKKASPRYKQPLPHLTPEYLPGLPIFTRRFFEKLFGRMKSPSVLVLDNYHLLQAESPIHDLLETGLNMVPQGCTAIVMSREHPPPAMARLQAEQSLRLIDAEALKLSPRETKQIVQLHTLSRPTKQQALKHDKIQEITQGWVGGLVLLLQNRDITLQVDLVGSERVPDVLFHYLAREALKRLPEETQTLLLTSSIFPFFTSEMASRLSGAASAKEQLNRLYQSRYFIERRAGLDQAYQYHPLYQKFLQANLHEQYSQKDITVFKKNAGHLLKEAGWVEEAVELLQSAKEYETLAEIIISQAGVLLAQGRGKTLEQWIRILPNAVVDKCPWVMYWLGCCLLAFEPTKAQSAFEQTFQVLRKLGDRDGALMAWCGYIDATFFLWEDMSGLGPWVDHFPLTHAGECETLEPNLQAMVSASMFTALYWGKPVDPSIREWADRAVAHLPSFQQLHRAMGASVSLGRFYCERGDMKTSYSVLSRVEKLVHVRRLNGIDLIMYYTMKQIFAYSKGEIEQANEMIDETMVTMKETGVFPGVNPYVPAVYSSLASNKPLIAKEYLNQIRLLIENKRGYMFAHYHYMEAWALIVLGDFQTAFYHIDLALSEIRTQDDHNARCHCELAMEVVQHELGQSSESYEHLRFAKTLAEMGENLLLKFQCLLIEAYIGLSRRDSSQVRVTLQAALEIGRASNYYITHFWIPKMMTRLCVEALKQEIEVEYVRDLIRQRELTPEEPPLAIPHWPWPIKIFTLRTFGIELDSEPLKSTRKIPKRLLAFLKAIIAFGGQNIREETLSDALWPDAEGDTAHQAFATTLHRLRKLLKHDDAIILQHGKVSLNPQLCWVDALAFEHLVKHSDVIETKEKPEDARQLRKQALELYHSQFLGDEPEESWIFRIRDRLRTMYIRQVGRLASELEHEEKVEQAIQHLEHAINIEPLAEPLYRQSIQLLKSVGHDLEAAALNQRLQQELKDHLGLETLTNMKARLVSK